MADKEKDIQLLQKNFQVSAQVSTNNKSAETKFKIIPLGGRKH